MKELGKEDGQPQMKNGPISEWSPRKIIMDKQGDERDFNNLLNDLKCRHKDDDNSVYVLDASDDDEDSIG